MAEEGTFQVRNKKINKLKKCPVSEKIHNI